MKPNIDLPESPESNSCPCMTEASCALRLRGTRQGEERRALNHGGKFYRGKDYRGKFYRNGSPSLPGNIPSSSRVRGTTRDSCPGISGLFDRILNLGGALSSDFLE